MCMPVGGCRNPFLDEQTLLQFEQVKACDEANWEAARSFCRLHFSFVAIHLSQNYECPFSMMNAVSVSSLLLP